MCRIHLSSNTALHRPELVTNLLLLFWGQFLDDVEGDEKVLKIPKFANFDTYDPRKEMPGFSLGASAYRSRVTIIQNGIARPDLGLAMITPTEIPATKPLTLYWDHDTTFKVACEKSKSVMMAPFELKLMQKTIHIILRSVQTNLQDDDTNHYAVLITPDIPSEAPSLQIWLSKNRGTHRPYNDNPSAAPPGIIRSHAACNRPHQFIRWIHPSNGSMPLIRIRKFKRNWN